MKDILISSEEVYTSLLSHMNVNKCYGTSSMRPPEVCLDGKLLLSSSDSSCLAAIFWISLETKEEICLQFGLVVGMPFQLAPGILARFAAFEVRVQFPPLTQFSLFFS